APAAGPGAALGTTIVPKTANQARAGDRATAADVLRTRYDHTASAALQRDLLDVERLPLERLRNKLRAYRRGVEPLPDERGRLTRTLALAWAAIPAWIGLEREEAKLRSKADAKVAKRFDRVAVWRSATQGRRDLLRRYAPTIAVEWPQDRGYPIDDDRIGTVRLAGGPGAVEVHIDPASPALYAYTWTAKIHGRRHRQLVYVWWFPERPEMTPRDPSAGRIDGGMLRITLDARDRPLIVESSLNCGCGHQVFVSAALEASARRAYGGPLPGKRFATEQHMRGKHDVIVIDTFDLPDDKTRPRPVIYVAAGYHEVCRVTFADPAQRDGVRVVADAAYALMDYRVLERLPLGDGVASMFGADGLVHGAGRPEGYLLAPTGILSAGQPRQRGTHRIRWDDFLFDDPHLLERTLRWPTYTAP
ncbi:MAG: hypothetical protein ACE5E6_12125, partial [Phycisphaerae bacterium]